MALALPTALAVLGLPHLLLVHQLLALVVVVAHQRKTLVPVVLGVVVLGFRPVLEAPQTVQQIQVLAAARLIQMVLLVLDTPELAVVES